MAPGPEADPLYLDRILAIVAVIREEVLGLEEAVFLADRNLADATALRLGSIGELSRKLSSELRDRHPHIDWARMSKLRNIVAHHYDRIDYHIIWTVATHALGNLEAACRVELEAIDGGASSSSC